MKSCCSPWIYFWIPKLMTRSPMQDDLPSQPSSALMQCSNTTALSRRLQTWPWADPVSGVGSCWITTPGINSGSYKHKPSPLTLIKVIDYKQQIKFKHYRFFKRYRWHKTKEIKLIQKPYMYRNLTVFSCDDCCPFFTCHWKLFKISLFGF